MKTNTKTNKFYVDKIKAGKYPIYLLLGFFVLAVIFSWWFILHSIKLTLASTDLYINHNSISVNRTNDKINTNIRKIDGKIMEKQDQASYWPYAVMIENLLSVRPQAGLSQASVVYEALVEGGATRFMAVFDPSEIVPEISPVRSVRPYYIEFSSEYNALLAHCGGSPLALQIIRDNQDIHDLNQISRDSKYFLRDKSLSAPHNLLTSSEKLNYALRDKGLLEQPAQFQSWQFKDETTLAERGEDGKTLTFNFSYGLTYKVSYQYNKEKNVYLRFNADQPHKDRNTDQQIEVKNVVVQLVKEPVLSGGQGRLDIQVEGEGKAWILRDGQIIAGTWKKASRTDRTLFYDKDGQEVELNRGNTWVHVLPETQEVVYD